MPDDRSRRRWSGPAVALATLALVAGIPEVVTRLVDPPLRQYRAIRFGSDPESPRLFMTDPRLHWRLRPGVDLTFLGTRVRTDAAGFRIPPGGASGGRTVLCLGDSATFGWLVEGEQTFAAELERELRARAPTGDWRVRNAGVPGYSSYQVRQVAADLVPAMRPDVLVVCVGNNEAAPATRTDREMDESRWLAAPLARAASVSAFATWLGERLSSPPAPPPHDPATRRVPVAGFAENVRAIVDAGRRAGARVVVLSPPVNPFAPPRLDPELPDRAAVVAWCEATTARIDAGDAAGALVDADARLAADPRAFWARWLRGYALVRLGDVARGTAELERAIEDDPLADRCPRSYRDALARAVAPADATFVDADVLLRAGADEPLDARFADHCHPNAAGHAAIAARLADVVLGGGGAGAVPSASGLPQLP